MENSIKLEHLSKTYKASPRNPAKNALKDVSIDIEKGPIFGLLGPNGAGKSTIINILAGITAKTSGTVSINGIDIDKDPRNARASIGVVPQELNFDPFFTPRAILEIQAGLFGIRKKDRRTDSILELLGLKDKADVYTRSLSGGMRRRLMIAKAMVHTPPVLVLDEPTAGVDIELRMQLWESVRKLNREGLTVLLTTHYLEEAQQLCDRIAIINHGEVVACDEKDALISMIDTKEMRIKIDRDLESVPQSLEKYSPQLDSKRTLVFNYSPKDLEAGKLFREIENAECKIIDVSTRESDLEDVFLRLTHR